MDVDAAFMVANTLLSDAASRMGAILTEEDAKVQVITRLLTEVLGWSHSDLASETQNENGFSDYLIRDSGRDLFLIEAKKSVLSKFLQARSVRAITRFLVRY
jgi:predicted type IV restriction endonuclease